MKDSGDLPEPPPPQPQNPLFEDLKIWIRQSLGRSFGVIIYLIGIRKKVARINLQKAYQNKTKTRNTNRDPTHDFLLKNKRRTQLL